MSSQEYEFHFSSAYGLGCGARHLNKKIFIYNLFILKSAKKRLGESKKQKINSGMALHVSVVARCNWDSTSRNHAIIIL